MKAPHSIRVFEDHYHHSHPSALALYCSDGRFTRGVERLMSRLGHDRIDTLCMPGGPALLEPASAEASEMDAIRRAVSFLIRAHDIRELLLLAHQGCGYYKQRHPDLSDHDMEAKQLADLRAASTWASKAHPGTDVDIFFAHAVGDRVVFTEIDPD